MTLLVRQRKLCDCELRSFPLFVISTWTGIKRIPSCSLFEIRPTWQRNLQPRWRKHALKRATQSQQQDRRALRKKKYSQNFNTNFQSKASFKKNWSRPVWQFCPSEKRR